MHNYEVIKEEKSKSELSTSGIVNRINNSTNVIVERTHLHAQAFIRQMQAREIGKTPVREEGIRNLHSQIAAALERGTRVRACSGAATVCEERRRAERRRGRRRVPAIERGARVTVVRRRSPARRRLAESPRVTAVRRRASARRQLADSVRRRAESPPTGCNIQPRGQSARERRTVRPGNTQIFIGM